MLKRIADWLKSLSDKIHSIKFSSVHLGGVHQSTLIYGGVALGVLIACTLLILSFQRRSKRDLRERLKLSHELMYGLRASAKLEENLNHVLQIVSRIVAAPYYSFYIWDTRNNRFVLRAVSHPYDTFEGVGPAYSGLALPKKEAYLPPSVLEISPQSEIFELTRDGAVPMAAVRIGEKCGLIRIGPINAIDKRDRQKLTEIATLLSGTLADYLSLEVNRTAMELTALSDAAITKVASLASNKYITLQVLLQAFTGIAGGKGGLFIEHKADGSHSLYASEQVNPLVQELERDAVGISRLIELGSASSETIIKRSDGEFYDLPNAIVGDGEVGAVVIVPFRSEGMLVMLQDQKFNLVEWKAMGRKQLRLLTHQINNMLSQGMAQHDLAKGYTRLLCQIADMVDNLNPYTVGYSEMMTHYSLAIGKQMGLSDGQMRDLALAAHLSNIGLVGMDLGLLFKEGQYTDFEYSVMKRHSEISASMIEMVTGNRRAAQYVLYHHERVDGLGYPVGLHGNEIPDGAKILHVVQVFLAKVNGRSWRSPLSFELAMRELRNSVGLSLDEAVVSAFEAWWEKLGNRPGYSTKTIGKCYEMCCVPKTICQVCPAYTSPIKCWEMPDNHCKSHGRECNTCFVKTEYLYRTRRAN